MTILTIDQGGTGDPADYLQTKNWVKSATTSAQPGSPSVGDRYALPASPTGAAWSGNGGKIAEFITLTGGSTGWTFATPTAGYGLTAADTGAFYVYNGGFVATHVSLAAAASASSADSASVSLGVPVLLDADLTLSANTTFSAQWRPAAGVITLGSHNLGISFPETDVYSFNQASTGTVTFAGGSCARVDARAFGCTGGGSATSVADTAAINAAIVAAANSGGSAPSLSGGLKTFIPPGVCLGNVICQTTTTLVGPASVVPSPVR